MCVSCTAARSWGRVSVIQRALDACVRDRCKNGEVKEAIYGGGGTLYKLMQILVTKNTCSLLTVKLRLGCVGWDVDVLLEAATLEEAEGALGRFEEPGLRGDVVVGGGGGDVSGGAPALGTPPTRSM